MPLDMVVCIKQVPDPEHFDRIRIDPASGTIRRAGIPAVTNAVDRHAVEEALRIRERFGGTVTVMTMGPPQARKTVEDALAMGADRGAVLCDAAFAGADTLASSCVLAAGVKLLGRFDLVLCGNESADGATGQVPVQMAEFLDVPHVACAEKIEVLDERRAVVERVIEGGRLRIETSLPAVIAVVKAINTYRLPTVFGIMDAAKKDILEWGCAACASAGVDACDMGLRGSPTRVAGVFESPQRRSAEMLTGEPQDVAAELIRRLRRLDVL